jgi:hypothetical protein
MDGGHGIDSTKASKQRDNSKTCKQQTAIALSSGQFLSFEWLRSTNN